ncbi:MAG: selenide, water dikinase SelD, partial [Deltaproteobacteria bacterium]|nr:selenide, water dikinase SelD [Deltaproteobacteria bacterium]
SFVETGIVPAGLNRNRAFRKDMVGRKDSCPPWLYDVLFDPQTSGGLLIAIDDAAAPDLIDRLRNEGVEDASIVGRFVDEPAGRIIVM